MSGVSRFWFIRNSVLIAGRNSRRGKRAVSLVGRLNAGINTA